MSKFINYNLKNFLIKNLKKQYIVKPTKIQELSIPVIKEKNDIIAEAKTGSGKTLAFLLPILNNINPKNSNIQSLILTPTRELTKQVFKEACKLTNGTNINVLPIYGGKRIKSQISKLNNSIQMIICTPGRLIDHLERGSIDLNSLNSIVLDEADQMLLIGFQNEIQRIMTFVPNKKQFMCFSATLNSKVKKIAYRYSKNPKEISIVSKDKTLETLNQVALFCSMRDKKSALLKSLKEKDPFLAIIFCRTKRRVDELEFKMSTENYNCAKLHSGLKQNKREKIINRFRCADLQYLIATDVASRGLDITNITHIYNYDFPESKEDYIHRIGRTARMGKKGTIINLIAPREKNKFHEIEKKLNINFKKEWI